MATPWDAEAGTQQQRIPVPDAPDGSYVYEFGHALPGIKVKLATGDTHAISQMADLSIKKLLRATVLVRAPTSMPPGIEWRFTGGIFGEIAVPTNDATTRIYRDFALGTPEVAGPHNVLFRLQLTGPSLGDIFEVELPSVQLDALQEDDGNYLPGVANRVPEPGFAHVSRTSLIQFEIVTSGDPVDLSRTTVRVDGVVIYQNGAFVGSWAFGSFVGNVNSGELFRCNPPDPFGSDVDVTVHVTSTVTSGVDAALVTSWTFHTVDETAPAVVSATQLTPNTVRVTFNEPMRRLNDLAQEDALTTTNYRIELVSPPPAVIPDVSVALVDDDVNSVVLIVLDDFTHKTTYRVVVSNVVDVSGNVIGEPSSAEFSTVTRTDIVGRNFWLIRKLPQGLVETDTKLGGSLRRFIACLQILFDELLGDIDLWPDIFNPDLAAEQFLDAMLEDLGNPFPFILDERTKRKLALLLVSLYQTKGTDQGMIDAIRLFLDIEVQIFLVGLDDIWTMNESEMDIDTYLGSSDIRLLYSFDVISPIILTDEQRQMIRTIVAYMRRAPTHLRYIIEPPALPENPDHWELGLSEMDDTTILHL